MSRNTAIGTTGNDQIDSESVKTVFIFPSAAAGRNQGFGKLMKRPRAISLQQSASGKEKTAGK